MRVLLDYDSNQDIVDQIINSFMTIESNDLQVEFIKCNSKTKKVIQQNCQENNLIVDDKLVGAQFIIDEQLKDKRIIFISEDITKFNEDLEK